MSNDETVYRAPASELSRPIEGNQRSLDAAIAGDFDFNVVEILGEGWDLVGGSKRVILGALLIMIGLSVASEAISMATAGSDPTAFNPIGTLAQFAASLASYPIQAGLFIFAIKRAAGDDSASFDDVFSCFGRFLPILGITILQGILILIGLVLLVLPGIYLAVAYSQAMGLLVERQLGVWESLETSRKALTTCWFQVFLLFLALFFIVLIGGMLTVGIGLIWLIPFGWLCLGRRLQQGLRLQRIGGLASIQSSAAAAGRAPDSLTREQVREKTREGSAEGRDDRCSAATRDARGHRPRARSGWPRRPRTRDPDRRHDHAARFDLLRLDPVEPGQHGDRYLLPDRVPGRVVLSRPVRGAAGWPDAGQAERWSCAS